MTAPYGYGAEPAIRPTPAMDDVMDRTMNFPKVTRQTNASTIPLNGQPAVPTRVIELEPTRLADGGGPLQWLLEGRGWDIIRPVVDLLAACVATLVALGGIGGAAQVSGRGAPLLALPVFVMILLYVRGLYRARLRALFLDSLVPVAGAVSVASMAVVVLGLVINDRAPMQADLITAWACALTAVGVGRAALAASQRWARATRRIGRPVLILGAGVVGAHLAQRLEAHPEYGLRPVGFLDDDPRSAADVGKCEVPVVGTVEDVDAIVESTGVEHLIVAFSSVTDSRVSTLIQRCQELGIEVSVVPRMFDAINNRVEYDSVGGLPLLSFSTVSPRGAKFALKHAIDRAAAASLLLALSPIMIAVALAVRLTSRGPILFRQRRVGRDGKVFDLYKFRSMQIASMPDQRPAAPSAIDGEPMANAQAERRTDNSPRWFGRDIAPGGVEGADRRTPIGRFIRRTALDELPQLINVLRGEMSLVGPRPERPEYVELFRKEVARYGDRHRVKSGITGWAQVHGLRGKTSLAERVEWDNYYIAHWSLGLDLKILLLTVLALFHGAE
ncbi:MAG: exopolysaccharide biosynthesis polyprenyl glycosylphosphotransferase [Solirubrobacteraceae bacterium]